MSTALTDYFIAKLGDDTTSGDYDDLIDEAANGFSSAVTDLAQANADNGVLLDELGQLDGEIAGLRTAAAGPNLTPADLEGLAVSLREKLIERRQKWAQLLAAKERIADARLLKKNFGSLLAQYKSLRAQCVEQAAAAAARGEFHTVWFSTDTADAVDADKATAATLLAEISATPDAPADPDSEIAAQRALIAAAHARVEADIPEVLRDRARARATTLVIDYAALIDGQMRDAEDADVDFRVANYGDSGTLAQRWLTYDRADAELRDAATRTAGKLKVALGLLEKVRDTAPLTAAETAQIADVALAAGADAITTEAARDSAAAAVDAKRIELELAIVAAVIADPTADPDTDATVLSLAGELATLETALDTATTNHTAAFALELDTWEVAVPNAIWRALLNYDTAIEGLTDVAGTDLSGKLTALTTAETSLVAALGEDEASRQAQRFAATAVGAARERAQFIAGELGARRISALRGDA